MSEYKEMIKEYKKLVQIPFEEYKEKTKTDTKATLQHMIYKMANQNIKLFEGIYTRDEYIKMLEEKNTLLEKEKTQVIEYLKNNGNIDRLLEIIGGTNE